MQSNRRIESDYSPLGPEVYVQDHKRIITCSSYNHMTKPANILHRSRNMNHILTVIQ